ncbi:MAG TPA: nucleoside 2-deoxyribosyltransferase [Patescibacteria group bacterium]|nr:nucleoside 2-deoxyribosyltransferase [Patescibacteria group bacterium]
MIQDTEEFTAFLSAPLIALLDDNLKAKKESELFKNFYKRIATISTKHSVSVYEPYAHMDPNIHDYIRPEQIYQKNRDIIRTSDLLIAYIGILSAGVSIEIEIASSFGVPVILLCEESKVKTVSRMILGCRMAQSHIFAQSVDEISKKYDERLPHILNSIREDRTYSLPPKKMLVLKQLVQIHEKSQLSIGDVSQEASIDKSYISRLLNGKISRPGRDQLIRLCGWGWKLDIERTNEILKDSGYETLW